MCKTREEIAESLSLLEDIPGLGEFKKPNIFHGVVEWTVVKGSMRAFRIFDHFNCEAYHAILSRDTEVSWHNHNVSKECLVCLDGTFTLYMEDGSSFTLNPQDTIEIKKYVTHMATTSDGCELVAMTIPKENER